MAGAESGDEESEGCEVESGEASVGTSKSGSVSQSSPSSFTATLTGCPAAAFHMFNAEKHEMKKTQFIQAERSDSNLYGKFRRRQLNTVKG